MDLLGLVIVFIIWVVMDLCCIYRYKYCKYNCAAEKNCRNWMCKNFSKYKFDKE